MIGNQVHFGQLIQKFLLKLADKQVHWLLKHIIKQGFNFTNQNCKLHSENRKLIIMLYAENFSFFYICLTLQVILIIFVKKAKQIWIGLKIQMIIAVLFVI